MVQGVRHVLPSEVRASAPGGVDWINSNVVVGFGLKALKPGMELQDASPTPQITTARAREGAGNIRLPIRRFIP